MGMIEPTSVGRENKPTILAQNSMRFAKITAHIADMLEDLKGQDDVGTGIRGGDVPIIFNDEITGTEVGSSVDHIEGFKDRPVGLRTASEVDRYLARPRCLHRELFDCRPHPAQGEPVGVNDTRMQSAL